jgi:hypothetical protein
VHLNTHGSATPWNELRDLEVVAAAGRRWGGGGAAARARAARGTRGRVGAAGGRGLVQVGGQTSVGQLDVVEESLGVAVQRVAELLEMTRERAAVVQDAAGGGMGLGDDVARVGLGVALGLLGVGVGVGAQARRLGLGLTDRRSLALLGLLARLPGALVDQAHALAGLGLGGGGFAAGCVEDLTGLGLGRLDAQIGGALGLGDPLADLLLGLEAEILGGALGGLDDRGDLRRRDRDLAHGT